MPKKMLLGETKLRCPNLYRKTVLKLNLQNKAIFSYTISLEAFHDSCTYQNGSKAEI